MAADAPGAWVPVGVSRSRLRVFVEQASLRVTGDHRIARIRIGSPTTIVGPIVIVYQDEEIDCRAQTWRMLGYDARDAQDHVVRSGHTPAAEPLPGVAGNISGEVIRTVCAM